jgi:hypothetical protein
MNETKCLRSLARLRTIKKINDSSASFKIKFKKLHFLASQHSGFSPDLGPCQIESCLEKTSIRHLGLEFEMSKKLNPMFQIFLKLKKKANSSYRKLQYETLGGEALIVANG